MRSDSHAVGGRGVARILLPLILWKLSCQGTHVLIAESFGQDGRGSNATVDAIATDNASVLEPGKWSEPVAINQQVGGRYV